MINKHAYMLNHHLFNKDDYKHTVHALCKFINKNERIGRNPKTKEKHIITARKSISFLSSKNISEKLNQLIDKR